MARQSFVLKTANCLASSTSRAPDKVRENAKQLLQEIADARIMCRLFGVTPLSRRAPVAEAGDLGEEP